MTKTEFIHQAAISALGGDWPDDFYCEGLVILLEDLARELEERGYQFDKD